MICFLCQEAGCTYANVLRQSRSGKQAGRAYANRLGRSWWCLRGATSLDNHGHTNKHAVLTLTSLDDPGRAYAANNLEPKDNLVLAVQVTLAMNKDDAGGVNLYKNKRHCWGRSIGIKT